MTDGHSNSSPLFTGVLHQREARVAQFEEAWFAGLHPTVEGFLPASDDALRTEVLSELVLVDLECRLKAGEPARAEAYLEKYPELAGNEQWVQQLLLHEFEIRRQSESVALDEYADRFPQYVAGMRARVSLRAPTNKRPDLATITTGTCPHCCASFRLDVALVNGRLVCPHCGEAIELLAPEAPQRDPDSRGRLGKFELLEVAGRGAFGTVWRARDTELDRIVAVKIPSGGQLMEVEEVDRFLREARSMAQLRHPGVVAVHESGRFDGTPFIVIEFIRGMSLSQALVERRFPANEAAELLRRVARALDYAHQQGIVHRDLKPSNIMLDNQPTRDSSNTLVHFAAPFGLDYEPRVMDFGLALREHGEATVTVDGQIVGTAAYMSPEQARGESHHVDRRSDVYSVGVILYEMLAGETPFRGNLRMVLQQVLHDEPRLIRRLNDRIPRDLETICLKCLEKEPVRRYESAGELAAELERFLTNRPITARPVGRAERAWRWCRRHPSVATLTAAIVAVLVVGFAGVTWQWLATRRAEQGRTLAQVDALLGAAPEAIPALLAGLAPYRAEVAPLLERKLTDQSVSDQEKLRARLGLLADDAAQAEPLFAALFAADLPTFMLLRQQLLAGPVPFEDRLTDILRDERESPARRFRAVCYLAASPHVPQHALKSYADFAARQLVANVLANPSDYATARDALRPMAGDLTATLTQLYGDTSAAESARRAATNLLADYAGNEPVTLANLLLDAEPWQMPILTPVASARQPAAVVERLQHFLVSGEADDTNVASVDRHAKQRANAAIALVELGADDSVWPLLASGPDSSARSYFIDRFPRSGSDAPTILKQLGTLRDESIRRALYLTLGGFRATSISVDELAAARQSLLATFVDDADPGTHSAVRWLLNHWGAGQEIDRIERELAQRRTIPDARQRWYVNSQVHTMLMGGPATFSMGSPPDETGRNPEERLRDERIERQFAIAMCETSIDQFRRFDPQWRALGTDRKEDGNCPVCFVSWNQAAMYCNWLSEQDGIPQDQWCYVPDPAHTGVWQEAEECLEKSGYRLPTEAEWEFACRAGTTTARFFGQSAELLPQYAWCPANSPAGQKHPVGLLKPNELGLFDVYGNADEFCHDRLRDDAANYVITRGGAAGDLEPPRSALRNLAFNDPDNPKQGALAVGFRVARTIAARPGSTPGP